MYSSTSGFRFQKPDNSTVDINLTAAAIPGAPVFLDTVYTASTRKVGYFVFNSFLAILPRSKQFQRIINRFIGQNVDDVVVDLRYNGGGYVSLQQRLANYLVNPAADGQLMMREQFNDRYTSFNESTNFKKTGSLSLSRIFFIVSNSTASASELLINNLKPFMNVILMGLRRPMENR